MVCESNFRGYFASFEREHEWQSLRGTRRRGQLLGTGNSVVFSPLAREALDEPFGALFGNEKTLSMFLAVRFHTRNDYIRQADGPISLPLAK